MTIILALAGKSEVVMAADTMVHSGDNEGSYKFTGVRKLVPIRGKNWVLGYAGTGIGHDLYSLIEKGSDSFDDDIEIGVHQYARRMKELYKEHEYTGPAFLMMGGVHNDEAFIYGWNLEARQNGGVSFDGAMLMPGRNAIGANYHGALYFANAFHSTKMDTGQRILIAYLCVHEAAQYDPRVGGPIEVALVRSDGVSFFCPDDLTEVERESVKIKDSLRARFAAPGPAVRGLNFP